MPKFHFLLIFLAFQFSSHVDGLVEDVIDILYLGREVIKTISSTWELADKFGGTSEIDLPFMKRKEKKIFSRMADLTEEFKKAEVSVHETSQVTVQRLETFLRLNQKLEFSIQELIELVNSIEILHDQYQEYIDHQDTIETQTIESFARSLIEDSSSSVKGMLVRIQKVLNGPSSNDLRALGNVGLLQLIAQDMKEAPITICSAQRSPQQVLYQLYNSITLTELKGYVMMQFSYMILKTYGKGNYTQESILLTKNFERRSDRSQELMRKAMEISDQFLWRCDPNEHKEGKTYLEVTRLLQGYVENEVDLNRDGGCWENCPYYQLTESYGCFKELYCAKQPKCTGKLLFCTFFDADMWICPASALSSRRYDFIEFESGKVLGEKKYCGLGTTKVDSWWRYLFWHCSYCFCMCDEQGKKSDRYFNLRSTLSNVTNNMVVTGVRFAKKNRIIHLQIQEGQLMERGRINASSVHWIPLEDYTIIDKGIRDGRDYHTLAWDRREVDLDDLGAPVDHVVTGVKFRVVGRHLNLEMRVTEMDFSTGTLIEPEKSFWVSNDNTDQMSATKRRTELTFKNPDMPTRSHAKSTPQSSSNQFLKFTHSDISKDAAQTTVPFLDAQDVVNNPPVPLEGVGLFYKGANGYGGFLAPRIKTFNYGPFIQKPKN